MPTPIDRKSIDVSLEKRYESTHVGGAYDAKKAGKDFVDFSSNEFADGFTKGGANTKLPKKDSRYLAGFSNKKYKG